jgi:hypothetical protein
MGGSSSRRGLFGYSFFQMVEIPVLTVLIVCYCALHESSKNVVYYV